MKQLRPSDVGTVVAVGPNEDSVPEADADVSSDSESVIKPGARIHGSSEIGADVSSSVTIWGEAVSLSKTSHSMLFRGVPPKRRVAITYFGIAIPH